jgi:hypothetical protein
MVCAIVHLALFVVWVILFDREIPNRAFGMLEVLVISLISWVWYYARKAKVK